MAVSACSRHDGQANTWFRTAAVLSQILIRPPPEPSGSTSRPVASIASPLRVVPLCAIAWRVGCPPGLDGRTPRTVWDCSISSEHLEGVVFFVPTAPATIAHLQTTSACFAVSASVRNAWSPRVRHVGWCPHFSMSGAIAWIRSRPIPLPCTGSRDPITIPPERRSRWPASRRRTRGWSA